MMGISHCIIACQNPHNTIRMVTLLSMPMDLQLLHDFNRRRVSRHVRRRVRRMIHSFGFPKLI